MKLINSENNKSLIFPNAQSPCAIILVNLKGPCIYLFMGFNVYLGPLVQADGATLISTISLVDGDVGSFSSYIYLPTPWAKHTKTTVKRAPNLGNPSCSKLYFSLLPSPSSSLPPRCSARPCPIVALTCSSSSRDQPVRPIVAVFRCLRIVQHFRWLSPYLSLIYSVASRCFYRSRTTNRAALVLMQCAYLIKRPTN